MTAEPAVPQAVKPQLELHKGPEPEWISIKEAAELIADGEPAKKVERRIRFWAKDNKISSKPEGDAPNARILVILEEVEEAEAGRPEKERRVETLPVPTETVFLELRDMRKELVVMSSQLGTAEAVAKFQTERVKELKEQLATEREKAEEKPKRWFRRG